MKKALVTVAALTAFTTFALPASASRKPVTVVAEGVKSCAPPQISIWFRYSNGTTKTHTYTVQGAGEIIIRRDPQGRPLPKGILVNYQSAPICVTDVFPLR